MKHTQIALAAAHAASFVADPHSIASQEELIELYGYARFQQFPPAETLARKLAHMSGESFPDKSLEDCREPVRAFFLTFRAVALALDPLHEPDDADQADALELPGWLRSPAPAELDSVLAEAGCDDRQNLVDMAKVGSSLMDAIGIHNKDWPIEDWGPAEDPAEIVGDLVNIATDLRNERDALKKDIEDMTNPNTPDDVEARTKAAQEATDQVIAESGGQFSQNVSDPVTDPAKPTDEAEGEQPAATPKKSKK